MHKQDQYVQCIQTAYPSLAVRSVRLHTQDGQFNDIIMVNEALIFRFPRSAYAASTMEREVVLLRALQQKTSLPIPDPIYAQTDHKHFNQNFMGYVMLPGVPLLPDVLDTVTDEACLERLAHQIARFLRALHALPIHRLLPDLPHADGREALQALYQAFHDQLFPYMRSDACNQVTLSFEAFLNEPAHFAYTPVLRHGDFGGSNIIYNPQTQHISGVIDFSFAAPGDPAVDAAAASTLGDAFFARICKGYPELAPLSLRAAFYKSTYALQQALYALRDGDQALFEDGISAYR